MNKLMILLMLCLALFAGCIARDSRQNDDDRDTGQIEDYLPFSANTVYEYTVTGTDYTTETVFFDYVYSDKAQRRTTTENSEYCEILDWDEEILYLINGRIEPYGYLTDFTKDMAMERDAVLKAPLDPGQEWRLTDGSAKTVLQLESDVQTPLGIYKALELETVYTDGSSLKEYYVKNVGLVKKVAVDNEDRVVESVLNSVSEIDGREMNTTFYYVDVLASDEIMQKQTRLIKVKTNDRIEDIFTYEFKNPPQSSFLACLSENAEINSIVLQKEADYITIDLNREFLTEMNLGSGFEGYVFQCLKDTIGGFFGVSYVQFTVDGESFSTGHRLFDSNEMFPVSEY